MPSKKNDLINKIKFNDLSEEVIQQIFMIINMSKTAISGKLGLSDFPKQRKFDLREVCESKGVKFDGDILKYMIEYTPEDSTTIIGKGEILIRTLLNGTPSSAKGDMIVSGKRIEVKYNKSRLRGMTGFGEGMEVAEELDSLFIHACKLKGFKGIEGLIGKDKSRWNFVSGRRMKPYLLSEIVLQTGMKPLEACKLFVRAFGKLFKNMTEFEALDLARSLSKEFKDGIIKEVDEIVKGEQSYSFFTYKMCSYAMKYYAKEEDFNGMIVLNENYECMYITRKFIDESSLEDLAEFIRKHFKIVPPSLTPKSGTQGSAFGIAL